MDLTYKIIQVVFKAGNQERNHSLFKGFFRKLRIRTIGVVEAGKDIGVRSVRNILNNDKRVAYERVCDCSSVRSINCCKDACVKLRQEILNRRYKEIIYTSQNGIVA